MKRGPPFSFNGGKGAAILKAAYEKQPIPSGIGVTVDNKTPGFHFPTVWIITMPGKKLPGKILLEGKFNT